MRYLLYSNFICLISVIFLRDVTGPIVIPSVHGHRYFLTVVDDHSRHTWIFLMHTKSETRKLIQNFIIHVKNQFDKTIKCFRTDNGP